ncbi:hypothetical protein O2U01_07320 [Ligilactobacillus salivarius]|uniref:Uncharacterized protein n=1 Tax=Ligilactobacillus salivarius TaxID=1624 RepID=A0ABD7YWD1_9LACO|nr:hypothetical protein [Ligilactobacillus salivarius]WHS06761.1 hypothetical protein O2U07_05640 [Ligilactobacillus salivarius]WHS08834.1 hypothetical protein O2U05_05115 [Ligilactobacillus salivarius]WHS10724.1 hypothetical protein O2U04_03980 [Ligilactobacillus salivarius]WHS14663.1 hypothetical protein O2U03_03185 [Ligilactobacillus salivarius]WHS18437.1 hypothetical protein O2U02_04250 [Ligilactobacillus salivarius]
MDLRPYWGKNVEVIDVLKVKDDYLVSLRGSNEIFRGTKLISSKSVYEVKAVESQSVDANKNKIIGVLLSSKPTEKILEVNVQESSDMEN